MMSHSTLTVSIVLYENDINMIKRVVKCTLKSNLVCQLFLIDNSTTDRLKNVSSDDRVSYIHNQTNIGFGCAHNIAINKLNDMSKYHLILNPDIYFDDDILNNLLSYMENNNNIGILMPKILYPNSSLQPLAKLLPSPLDLFLRRINIYKKINENILRKYELRDFNYDKIIEVPFLSGCFMLCRTSVLKKVLGFDPNIFLFMEDVDICRRVNKINYKTIVYPFSYVFHDHEKKSILKFRNFKIYIKSAIYYFNKWGWFFDIQRKKLNNHTLNLLR
jgi:GT2 family glycosyltransferase